MLSGSHGGDAAPSDDIPRYMELFRAGRMNLKPLITQRFALDSINEAIAGMRSGSVTGRCMVEF